MMLVKFLNSQFIYVLLNELLIESFLDQVEPAKPRKSFLPPEEYSTLCYLRLIFPHWISKNIIVGL